MAKTKHNQFFDTVDEIFTDAKNKGALHQYSENKEFNGREIVINGQSLIHFATTSYMGLGQDVRLKEAAIEAIIKYGVQFPLSKAYISSPLYKGLEDSLEAMFGSTVMVSKNSTLGHLGAIPSIVRDEDAVILDHQVHFSVQNACNILKVRGIPVEMIRHNNLNQLEEQIQLLRGHHKKVWHMIDGVYSMYGDCSPIHDLVKLLNKYEQLYLYVDDVHGMSWAGKNGTGYIMGEVKELHPRMVLMTTLGKSFGASGAVLTTTDKEIIRYVNTFGGAISFSAQMEPPSIAAAIASAKIHLSPEIYTMQNELSDKIDYCNQLLSETDLPLYVKNRNPIFYIGTGQPSSGYNMSKRLRDEGFYVNVGIFPAVPVKNTGIRFSICRHNTKEDIKNLVQAMQHHYPKMLEEEGRSLNDIRAVFHLPLLKEEENDSTQKFFIEHYNSIHQTDKEVWNKYIGSEGAYDWDALTVLEKAFSGNLDETQNWNFHYFFVKDGKGKIIIATFFIASLFKEDMIAPPSKSQQIEEKRKKDPNFLVTRALSMGTLITEGKQCYVDLLNHQWKEAFHFLLKKLNEVQAQEKATTLLMRDFEEREKEIKEYLLSEGFFKVDAPDSSIIFDMNEWNTKEEYLALMNKKVRDKVKSEVFRYEDHFDIEIKKKITEQEAEHFYHLYLKVKDRNYDINIFNYPIKMIKEMSGKENWEYIVINLKPEYDKRPEGKRQPIGVVFCYSNYMKHYIPLIMGMDYEYLEEFKLYKQCLYQMIHRAKQLKAPRLYFGFSATQEKKKLGATAIPKVMYIQSQDNFAMEFIENMVVKKIA